MRSLVLMIIILAVSANISEAQIYSTASGGNWDDTLTWAGHKIPTATDDVVIAGNVNAAGGYYCNNLTVSSNTIFQHIPGSYNVVLFINGNVINNGTIRNNPNDYVNGFILSVKGNITNNGTWNNYSIELTGSSNQILTTNSELSVLLIEASSNAECNLVSGSDLYLKGVNINLKGRPFTLTGDNKLYLTREVSSNNTSRMEKVVFEGNGNEFHVSGGAFVENSTLNNVKLKDKFLVGYDVYFGTNVVNEDTLMQFPNNYPTSIYVEEDFVNNGVILDNPEDNDYLALKAKKNITNNGEWKNYYLELTGNTDQVITTNAEMEVRKIEVSSTNTSNLVSGSDLYFTGVIVDLNWNKFKLAGNNNLYLAYNESTSAYSVIEKAVFEGNGNEFHCSGNAHLENSYISNTRLKDRFLVGYDVHFNENVTVEDTLMQFPNNYSTNLYLDEDFINSGVISDNPDDNDQLVVNVNKNITNNGKINNGILKFTGTEDQEMMGSEPYSSRSITMTDTSSRLIIEGSVIFKAGYAISLGEGTLEINPNSQLTLIPDAINVPRIEGGIINGNGNPLILKGLSLIDNVTVKNTVLKGLVDIGHDVYFGEGVVNEDTLQQFNGNYDKILQINGNFVNNGLVRQNPDDNDAFIIEVKKNLVNNGIWNPHVTKINGTNDQEISLRNPLIGSWGNINFESGISGSSFQWKKNNINIEGFTNSTAVFDTLSVFDRGIYTCVSDFATSRSITVIDSSSGNSFGNIAGKVTNAVNGEAIAGATVSAGGITDITDANGNYLLENVPVGLLAADFTSDVISGGSPLTVHFTDKSAEGDQVVSASAENFISYENRHIRMEADGSVNVDISLSPVLQEGEYRIVLNWSSSPSDLDSHLLTPEIEGTSYHVYFSSKGSNENAPYATLDHDVTNGYGPETITINSLYPGTYKYYIYQYSSSGDLKTSEAVVQVYNNSGLVRTVNIPAAGAGNYWNVLEIEGSTGEITVVNEINSSVSGSIAAAVNETLSKKALGKVQEITSRSWYFGDGSQSNELNPEHVYSEPGNYTVTLVVSNGSMSDTISAENYITVSNIISVSETETVLSYGLGQNYPNPFNPATIIEYSVPEETRVVLSLYDILGRRISTFVNEIKSAGRYKYSFDASALSAGVYLYRINAGEFNQTRKMVLVK